MSVMGITLRVGDTVFIRQGKLPPELNGWISETYPGKIIRRIDNHSVYQWVVDFDENRVYRFAEAELRKSGAS